MGFLPPKTLVVDDEPSVLELVRAYLEKEAYQVRRAEDEPSG